MSRQGFLEAIRQDPDADAPRLIYADWLDEHGEPDRAAFIRYGVATGRQLSAEGRGPTIRRFGLTMPGRPSANDNDHLGDFERGFLGRISLDSPDSLGDLARLRETEPAHALGFGKRRAGLGAGALPGLEEALAGSLDLELDFEVGPRRLLPDRFDPPCRRVLLTPHWRDSLGRLAFPEARHLTLRVGSLAKVADGLARCGPNLESFRLEHHETIVGEWPGSQSLAALDWPASLRHLDFGACALPAALDLLGSGKLPNLRSAGLSVRAAGPAALGDLKRWPPGVALRRLFLAASDTPEAGRLLAALRPVAAGVETLVVFHRGELRGTPPLDPADWPRLRHLSISGPGLHREQVAEVIEPLATVVEELDYWCPPPGFFRGPAWQDEGGLRWLKLTHVEAGDLFRLGDVPALRRLEALDADGGWTPAAVSALARSPLGKNLGALNLRRKRPDGALSAAAIDGFGPRCDLYWQGT